MGFFPPSFAFFRVQVRATAAGSEKVSLLGRQSRALVDGGDKARGCTSLCSAARFALLCAPAGGAAITGISRVIAVQTEIRGQLRS